LVLSLAQGLGAGLSPWAPGTVGSLAGMFWLALLLALGSPWWYGAGSLVGVGLSVWCCGAAERMLGQKDPASVVLDEMAALPLCFAGWIGYVWVKNGEWLSPATLFSGRPLLLAVAGFAAFRCVDILKPWPVRQSQAWPGGWGITADDVLAALYVNGLWVPAALAGWLEPAAVRDP